MKTLLWILGIGGAAAVGYYLYTKAGSSSNTSSTATQTPTTNTTGTATVPNAFFPSWSSFTQTALQNTTSTVNSAFSQLNSLSNIFGGTQGGNGVAISGSNTGSVNSAGSGTGVVDSATDWLDGDDFA